MKNRVNIKMQHNWKYEDKNYMKEVTKFMDLAEQIKDEGLKNAIVSQMLRCDMELTKCAEEKILK